LLNGFAQALMATDLMRAVGAARPPRRPDGNSGPMNRNTPSN
jgi:hypothetical protein